MLLVKPCRRTLQSSIPDTFFVERAVSILKRNDPISLNSISSQFTPQNASSLLFQCQFDKPLVLKFINWARNRHFFNLNCKCISIHILTRFKLYKTAQSLAENVAKFGDNKGNSVFYSLSGILTILVSLVLLCLT